MSKDQSVYRHVLRDALKIALKRRQLWFFGFFAMFLTTGGLVDTVMRALNDVSHREINRLYPASAPQIADIIANITPRGALLPPSWFLAVLFLLFVVLGALVWFSVIAQGAIVSGIAASDAKADPKSAAARGVATFWPLLVTNLLSKIALALVALGTAAPLGAALATSNPTVVIVSFLAFILFIALTTVVSIISFFTIVDIVLTRSSVWHAINDAITTFRRHWIVCVETAVVIFGADILIAALYIVGLLLLLSPFVIFLVIMQVVGTVSGAWFFLTALTVIVLAWTITMSAFAATFRYAVWTLLYERLQSAGTVAKIVRMLKTVPDIFRQAHGRS